MTGTLAPSPGLQFFDNNGDPLAGGKIYHYLSGSAQSIVSPIYSDSGLTTPYAQPAVMDSAGRIAIYMGAVSQEWVIKDANDVTILTVDPVSGVPFLTVDVDISGTAGEALAAGDVVYLSDGSGGRTAGRWYKGDADFTYASSDIQAIGFAIEAISSAASGSIRVGGRMTGLTGLTAGTVYYISATAGGLTATPPTNQRSVGAADTTTSLVITYFPPPASSTIAGLVTTGAQTFAGVKTFSAAAVFSAQPTVIIGTGSGSARMAGTLNVSGTVTGNVGVGEDILATYTVPADTLAANGQALRISAWGTTAANGNNKEGRIRFGGIGGTVVADTGVGAFNALAWNMNAIIVRTGAATQTSTGNAFISNSAFTTSRTAPGQTLSGTVDIVVTGEATNNDDIQIYGLIVEAVN